jgi:hypothetical protein
MKHFESKVVYEKMKGELTDEAMELLGITVDKIDNALQQCMSAGMSKRAAVKQIYRLWKFAEPKDE